jgi:hypothetical protein
MAGIQYSNPGSGSTGGGGGPIPLIDGTLTSTNPTITKAIPAGTYQANSYYPMGIKIGGVYTQTSQDTTSLITVNSAQSSLELLNKTLGLVWSSQNIPVITEWRSVTYGNGKYVAVGSTTDKAAISTDGITWTTSNLPVSAAWRSITYNNGVFVAIATTTIAATSPDGVTWTARVIPNAANWVQVTYGDNKFVAVSSTNAVAAYSTNNGETWTAFTLPVGLTPSSISYGAGIFLVVSSNSIGTQYATSTDGITWTLRNLPTNALGFSYYGLNSIIYANGVFAALGGSTFIKSSDGINWTLLSNRGLPSTTINNVHGFTWSNGQYIVVSGLTSATYSEELEFWTSITLSNVSDSAFASAVVVNNNTIVKVGRSNAGGSLAMAATSETITTPFSITYSPSTIY